MDEKEKTGKKIENGIPNEKWIFSQCKNVISFENDKDENYHKLKNEFNLVCEAITTPLPNSHDLPLQDLPSWFNYEKYRRGQKFAMDNYFSVTYAEMLSLFLVFAFPEGLATLIFTNKSSTAQTACKRYLDTGNWVRCWFQGNVLDPQDRAYKTLRSVRTQHINVNRIMGSLTEREIEERCCLEKILGSQMKNTQLLDVAAKDFQDAVSAEEFPFRQKNPLITQGGMIMTQFSFMGLVVLYPEKFGIPSDSEEGLEGFVHLWRLLGFLLGIEERFNLCRGTLEEVRDRCRVTTEMSFKPQLKHVNKAWEHMSRCVVEGIAFYLKGLDFEVSLVYLCRVLDIQCPRLWNYLSWVQKLKFYVNVVLYKSFLKSRSISQYFNNRVLKMISKANNKYCMGVNEDN